MSFFSRADFSIFVLGSFVAILLGWVTGYLFEFIAIMLFIYLAVTFARLHELYNWCQEDNLETIPTDIGVIGELSRHIYHFKKKGRIHKNKISNQLEKFERLVLSFPDGIIALSATDEINWFNKEASDYFGFRESDQGKRISQLIRHPGFSSFLNKKLKGGVFILKEVRQGNDRPMVKSEIRVLSYGENERLLVVRDITEIERVNQMRKDFVSNASHELRTPLTVMKGYVEMLMLTKSADPDHISMSLKKVEDQILKMQTMIEELLALSRLDEGMIEGSRTVVNLIELFEQLDVEFQPIAARKKQVLRFDLAVDEKLKCNKNSLLVVLRNLISNALNYTEKRGEIRVSWELQKSGNGVVVVKDTGLGIANSHLKRLTERFYRVPENNKMNKSGTGLGLSIVKHELERNDASLLIESKLGQGSSFQCVFQAKNLVPK